MRAIIKLSMLFALTIVVTLSCKKNKDENPTLTAPTSTIVPVVGIVIDVNGNPLSGVTVKAGTHTTTTDYSGAFYLPSVSFGLTRYTITFEKQGYFKLYRSGIPKAGKPIQLTVGLISENDNTYASQKTFSSTQNDSIQLPDGSEIVFPANAFITSNGNVYNGMVTVKACYLDPTWDKYGMFVFGGDLYGKDSNNKDVMLNPFSGLNVMLYDDSGNTLQLDSIHNVKATVKMKIPTPLIAEAPDTIETWEYANEKGDKQKKGKASKIGDKYMGQVAHFSYWSFEKSYFGKATIWGYVKKIVNNDSIGVAGVKVKVGRQIVITDADGKYEATVPDNLQGIVIVPIFLNIGLNPTILTNALSNNESKRVDFELPTGSIFTIKGVVLNDTTTRQPITNALMSAEWSSQQSLQKVITFTNNLGRFILPIEVNNTEVTIKAQTVTQLTDTTIYLINDTNITIFMNK